MLLPIVLVPLALGFAVPTTLPPCRKMAVSSPLPAVQRFLSMEYCTGCRWDFRAFWLVQELLDREPDFHLWIIPSGEAGTFTVKSITGENVFVKGKGGPFPDPATDLPKWIGDCAIEFTSKNQSNDASSTTLFQALSTVVGTDKLPCVDIAYTRDHRQRALYLAQECLRTFSDDIKSLSLRCVDDAADAENKSSIDNLQVSVISMRNDATSLEVVWERGFPETKVLKQKIRDVLVPDKGLGHSDNDNNQGTRSVENSGDVLEDDEAAVEARRFFGVA
jgi:selenoprotein W-related protein